MYTNPILMRDFADPSVLRTSDGWFYAYGTRSYELGNVTNIQCARSRNLITWEYLNDALPVKPVWAAHTREFWAPYTTEANGVFYLYFSTERDSGEGMAIGVAQSHHPAGPFVDSGFPLIAGEGFTTIDPYVFLDPVSKNLYLYWGSGHGPIWGMEMEDYLSIKAQIQPVALIHPSAIYSYEKLVEGAYVIFHHNWYYLFYSGDNVWEDGQYAVMVARSKQPLGSFQKLAEHSGYSDSVILKGNNRWISPGQNSIISDGKGDLWMLYHAVDTKQKLNNGTSNLRRIMLLDKIEFEKDWPKVHDGTPSLQAQEHPAIFTH